MVYKQLISTALNTVTVSLLEEIFTTTVCLLLLIKFGLFITDQGLKDYGVLSLKPKSVKRFLTAVLIPALASNIARYVFQASPNMVFLIFLISMTIGIVCVYKLGYIKNINILKFKIKLPLIKKGYEVCLCILGAVFANLIIEMPYSYLGLFLLGKSVSQMNSDILLNTIMALPERLIEFTVLALYIIRLRSKANQNEIYVDLFRTIKRNKALLCFGIGTMAFNIFWLISWGTVFTIYRYSIGLSLPLMIHAIWLVGIVLVPTFIIIAFVFCVYFLRKDEIREASLYKKRLKSYTNIARIYTQKQKYDKISSTLDDIEKLYMVG